jgi:hypothetical protein
MKFEEALIELRKGKRIKRECFPFSIGKDEPIGTYLFLIDILNDLDDWEVLKEPGKTFPEVFEAFKEGKKIRRKSYKIDTHHISLKDTDSETNMTYIKKLELLETDWEIID